MGADGPDAVSKFGKLSRADLKIAKLPAGTQVHRVEIGGDGAIILTCAWVVLCNWYLALLELGSALARDWSFLLLVNYFVAQRAGTLRNVKFKIIVGFFSIFIELSPTLILATNVGCTLVLFQYFRLYK